MFLLRCIRKSASALWPAKPRQPFFKEKEESCRTSFLGGALLKKRCKGFDDNIVSLAHIVIEVIKAIDDDDTVLLKGVI